MHVLHIVDLFFNHGLEVDVHLDAERLIIRLSLTSFLLDIIHASASLLTINLQFFNLIEAARLFGEVWCASRVSLIVCTHHVRVGSPSCIVALIAVAPASWYTYTSREDYCELYLVNDEYYSDSSMYFQACSLLCSFQK